MRERKRSVSVLISLNLSLMGRLVDEFVSLVLSIYFQSSLKLVIPFSFVCA